MSKLKKLRLDVTKTFICAYLQNELSAAVETTEQERDDMKKILSQKNEELELVRSDRDKIRSEWEVYQKDRLSLRFKVEEIQTKEFSFKVSFILPLLNYILMT